MHRQCTAIRKSLSGIEGLFYCGVSALLFCACSNDVVKHNIAVSSLLSAVASNAITANTYYNSKRAKLPYMCLSIMQDYLYYEGCTTGVHAYVMHLVYFDTIL
jgi:hypothetical protein